MDNNSYRPLSPRPYSRRLAPWWIVMALVLICAPVAADLGSVRRVVVSPRATEAALPLSGWVVAAGAGYTAEVVEAPQFGTWINEVYRPDEAFWRYGGDRITLLMTSGGVVWHETLVVIAGQPYRSWGISEDFEGSNGVLDPGWAILGDTSRLYLTDEAVVGDWSLAIDIGGGGAAVQRSATMGGGISGVDLQGGCATVNPDLPDGGSWHNPPVGAEPFVLFELNGGVEVVMKVTQSAGVTRAYVRAEASDLAFGCAPFCSTPWREVPLGVGSELAVWYGSDVFMHPSSVNPNLHFTVQPPAPAPAHRDSLTHLTRHPAPGLDWTVGARGGASGAPSGRVLIDQVVAWVDEMAVAAGPRVIAEDFAGGAWDEHWQASGPIELVPRFSSTRTDGSWYAAIDLPNASKTGAMLIDDLPLDSDRIRFEGRFDFGSASLGEGVVYTIWGTARHAGEVADPDAAHPVEFEFTTLGGQPHLRARALDDRGEVHSTPWLPVALEVGRGEWTPVVLHWWTDRVATGGLHLRVGDAEAAVAILNNRTQRIEEQAIGFWNPRSPGPKPQTTSPATPRLLFDDVIVVY